MKTAVLIDFDDTIFNATRYKTLRDEYYQQRFDQKFWKKFKKYEHDYTIGKVKMFTPRDILTNDELEITNRHLKKIAPSLLYQDFTTFMEKIASDRFTPMILTFGDQELQITKITAVGLTLPVIHTDLRNKNELIQRWRSRDVYKINGSDFDEVVLIDDRQSNFIGFEHLPKARGFLMQRAGNLTDDLPKNVSVVRDFSEIELV